MTTFNVHTLESAPEQSKKLLEKTQKAYGFIPNLYGVFAEAPAAVEAYQGINKALSRSSLSPSELQTVLLAVSVDNGCSYCVAAHSTVAQMSNVPDHVVKSLRDNTTIDDPKLEALRLFAKSVVDKRGWLDESDLEAFFAAGYGKQQVLEVITAISLKTLSNYTNHIANTPLDEPFTKNTWKR